MRRQRHSSSCCSKHQRAVTLIWMSFNAHKWCPRIRSGTGLTARSWTALGDERAAVDLKEDCSATLFFMQQQRSTCNCADLNGLLFKRLMCMYQDRRWTCTTHVGWTEQQNKSPIDTLLCHAAARIKTSELSRQHQAFDDPHAHAATGTSDIS